MLECDFLKGLWMVSLLFIAILLTDVSHVFAKDVGQRDWTQYRFNSSNNPVIDNNELDLFNQPIKTTNQIRSTPVVADNKVFVGNHKSGKLYAFNLNTGELLWKNQAPNWVHSEMIYVDGQLFVGYGNRYFQDSGLRGTGESGLLSLDPDNGHILWQFETDGEVMPTPAYYKDTVYMTTGDKHLYGLDPDKGTKKWSLDLGGYASMSSPNIKDGVLYVGSYASPYKFFAVDLDKKEVKWEHAFEKVISGLDDVPPVVSDDDLIYTTAVKKTNEPLEARTVYNKEGSLPAYKQIVKIAIGDLIQKPPRMKRKQVLYAMDADTGQLKWSKPLGNGKKVTNNRSGAPMLYHNKVFVGSPITQSFYAFNAKTGEKLWDYQSYLNKAPPAAKDNVVYFTDTKGLVYGFDTESGKLLGKKRLGGKLAPSGPIIVNDHLIVGSQDHDVYSVATEEILSSDDSAKNVNHKSMFSYIFIVYALPIVILIVLVVVCIYFIRRFRGKNVIM